jgi:hypothetical protein
MAGKRLWRGKRKNESTKQIVRHPGEMVAFGEFHRAGDLQDGTQRSLEIPVPGIPKAAPWEQWEALKYKNKQAYLCASRVPIVSSDPIKTVF